MKGQSPVNFRAYEILGHLGWSEPANAIGYSKKTDKACRMLSRSVKSMTVTSTDWGKVLPGSPKLPHGSFATHLQNGASGSI